MLKKILVLFILIISNTIKSMRSNIQTNLIRSKFNRQNKLSDPYEIFCRKTKKVWDVSLYSTEDKIKNLLMWIDNNNIDLKNLLYKTISEKNSFLNYMQPQYGKYRNILFLKKMLKTSEKKSKFASNEKLILYALDLCYAKDENVKKLCYAKYEEEMNGGIELEIIPK